MSDPMLPPPRVTVAEWVCAVVLTVATVGGLYALFGGVL